VLVNVCFSERERGERERKGERGREREKEWKFIRSDAPN
jgi:ribosomal protein S6E (S10)